MPATEGNDTLNGTHGAEYIAGLGGDDILIGAGGRDTLDGGDGNDTMNAGGFYGSTFAKAADDVLEGGEGVDMAILDYADLVWEGTQRPISIHFTYGQTFQIQIDGYVGATVSNVENINIRMADGDDNVTLGGGTDSIQAFGGNDTVNAGAGDDFVADRDGRMSLDGGGGTDRLYLDWGGRNKVMNFDLVSGAATAGGKSIGSAVKFESLQYMGGSLADRVTGGALADVIEGRDGNNVLNGAGGNDTLSGGYGEDQLLGGEGSDSLNGGYGTVSDRLEGGDGADTLTGWYGKDTLEGGAGNDTFADYVPLEGDIFRGGDGDDTIGVHVESGFGRIDGGAGRDTIALSTANFAAPIEFDLQAAGLAEADVRITGVEKVIGGYGNDTLSAAKAGSELDGNTGHDSLVGRGGNDTLNGGAGGGQDTIKLGAGSDVLVFYYLNSGHTDIVLDFNPNQDSIRLAGLDYYLGKGELPADRLVFGDYDEPPQATMAGPQLFYDEGTGRLYMDLDGTGTNSEAELLAVFVNEAALTSADFFITDFYGN